jgi:hypothetical protein
MLLRKVRSVLSGRCPLCGFREGSRSKRTPLDRWASFFRYYPLECRPCNVEFYSFVFKSLPNPSGR